MPNKKSSFSRRRRNNRQSARTSTVTMSRRINYTLPTDQKKVALKWSGTYVLDVGSYIQENYGVIGPGSRIPKYWNEFFGIYKYCYIEGVHFTFEVASTRPDVPFRLALAETNTDNVTPTSYLELAETPRSITRQVFPGGNHSVCKFSYHTRGSAIMGHRLEDDKESWNTVAAGPSLAIQPLMALGIEPIISGSGAQVTILVTIQYDLKYFTLNHL